MLFDGSSEDYETGSDTAPEMGEDKNKSAILEKSKEDELLEQIKTLRNEVLLAKADVENIRKRSEKERTEASQFGAFRFAKDLLKVVDGLDMALTNIEKSSDQTAILQGIKMVHQEFERLLSQHGIKKVDALHHAFDPAVHEAVSEIDHDSSHPSQTVVQVIQEGYMMQEKLLRPAMVSIKK